MYRVLDEHAEVRERRDQLRHPAYVKPELLATRPKQVWSWDITKFLGPVKWIYFYLYVLLDIFSRYVVGWLLAERESGTLAELLIAEACQRQADAPGTTHDPCRQRRADDRETGRLADDRPRREPRAIHAPMSQMTIHSPRPNSKP